MRANVLVFITKGFSYAAIKSDQEIIGALRPALEAGSIAIDQANKSMDKETLLEVAARAGRVELIRFLLENRANPNRVNDYTGRTPLLMLLCETWTDRVYEKFFAILVLLGEHGAKCDAVEARGNTRRTALHLAIAYNKDLRLILFLLGKGIDPNKAVPAVLFS